MPGADAIVFQDATKIFLDGAVVAFRGLTLSVREFELLVKLGEAFAPLGFGLRRLLLRPKGEKADP